MRDVGNHQFGRHDRQRRGGPHGPRGPWQGRGPGGGEGFEGFEGFGGRGFGRGGRERLERGAMRWIILDALRDGPKHGYEIIKSLDERTGGAYAPSPGAVYPTLQLLADLGLVRAAEDADRRVHELTDAGREALDEHADVLRAFWSRFDAAAQPERGRAEIRFVQDEMRELNRTVWEGIKTGMGRRDDATVRAVRAAVERCKNEVRAIIARGSAPAEAAPASPAPDDPAYNTPQTGPEEGV